MNLQLVTELRTRLAAGQVLTQSHLLTLAAECFHAPLFSGWDIKNITDHLETALNHHLLSVGLSADPCQALGTVATLQALLPNQTARNNEQQLWQQFSTPYTLAYCLAHALGITSSDVVLEPSAGTGNLATMAAIFHPARLIVNEICDSRSRLLGSFDWEQSQLNGEFIDDLLDYAIAPTVIIMNPPFSANGGRTKNKNAVGQNHVWSALQRLAPQGRMGLLLGEGMADDKPHAVPFWNKVKKQFSVRCNLTIPGKFYARFGTTFGTQFILIENSRQVGKTLTGEIENLSDLLPLALASRMF